MAGMMLAFDVKPRTTAPLPSKAPTPSEATVSPVSRMLATRPQAGKGGRLDEPLAGRRGTDLRAGKDDELAAPDEEAAGKPGARGFSDPSITTVSGPKDLGGGGFDWKIWFSIPAAAAGNGWVIKELTADFDSKRHDGSVDKKKSYHYWEAWELKKGKTVTVWQDGKLDDNDDRYYAPNAPAKTKGTISYVGKAKFWEGALPADFKKNNPDTIAGILHSSTTKPGYWDGTGTDHNIISVWDSTATPAKTSVEGLAGGTKVGSTP